MIYWFILLAFSLFFLLPVRFNFTFQKRSSDERIKLEVNLFLAKISLEIPEMRFTVKSFVPVASFKYKVSSKNTPASKPKKFVVSPLRDNFKKIIDSIRFMFIHLSTFKKLLKRVKLTCLDIYISFGNKNPALTGFVAGYIWGLIFQILGLLSSYLTLDGADLKVNILPEFVNAEPFQIKVNCIFHIRVGHIIIASFVLAWYYMLFNIKSMAANRKQYTT